jgi:hypothetical protein
MVELAGGTPSGPAWLAGATGDATRGTLPPGRAEATWLNDGAAEVQPCGTDIAPSDAARPALAVTAALPKPGELVRPAPGPNPVPSTDPDIWKL